jgi:ATP-binding cassette subfamily F protein 2
MLFSGLIGQVAEELWEVGNKTIRNLTKGDITIQDYKKNLVKQSMCTFDNIVELLLNLASGNASIEKAKLFSKTAPKGKA